MKLVKTKKMPAVTLETDDMIKFGGTLYVIRSKELNTFGRDNYAFYLRPVNVFHQHEDIRVTIPALSTITIYNKA